MNSIDQSSRLWYQFIKCNQQLTKKIQLLNLFMYQMYSKNSEFIVLYEFTQTDEFML